MESWIYQQGVVKARADDVLTVLEARGVEVSLAYLERIRHCTDRAMLDRWIRLAGTAQTAAELFDEPAT